MQAPSSTVSPRRSSSSHSGSPTTTARPPRGLWRWSRRTSALLLVFAAYLLAMGLHELSEAGVIPESEVLLVVAFAALAGPTLYFFFRRPRAPVTA